jgi:hypothetical protein
LLNIDVANARKLPPSVLEYIKIGEKSGFKEGYKCRIKNPWYQVPSAWIPDGFLFCQIHDFPRFVLNSTKATFDRHNSSPNGKGFKTRRVYRKHLYTSHGSFLRNRRPFLWWRCSRAPVIPRNDKQAVLDQISTTLHGSFLNQLPLNYDDITLKTIAKTYLAQAKLLISTRRAHFKITERGRSVLAENVERIDAKFLRRFDEFNAFL